MASHRPISSQSYRQLWVAMGVSFSVSAAGDVISWLFSWSRDFRAGCAIRKGSRVRSMRWETLDSIAHARESN
jgi:hypothetical protein